MRNRKLSWCGLIVANRLASTKQKLLQAGSSSLHNTVKEKKETGTSSNKE